MTRNHTCQHCRAPAFLSVSCAWPAQRCHSATQARVRPYTVWRRRVVLAIATITLMFGIWQIAQAAYIHAKAQLAQVLIKHAWQKTLAGTTQARPWPWADTWPVARLSSADKGIELYVLAGSNNRTIAFGPGHVFGTPLPGKPGNSVIGAHRDTHFAFLQWLDDGDEIEIQTIQGNTLHYRVTQRTIVDKQNLHVMAQNNDIQLLTLVTCYPFDAITPGGPLRYVVTAQATPPEST